LSISPYFKPEEGKSHYAFLSRNYNEKEILEEGVLKKALNCIRIKNPYGTVQQVPSWDSRLNSFGLNVFHI